MKKLKQVFISVELHNFFIAERDKKRDRASTMYLVGVNTKGIAVDCERLARYRPIEDNGRRSSGCSYVASVSAPAMHNAFISLAKKRLTPSHIVNVNNDGAHSSPDWNHYYGSAIRQLRNTGIAIITYGGNFTVAQSYGDGGIQNLEIAPVKARYVIKKTKKSTKTKGTTNGSRKSNSSSRSVNKTTRS